MTMHRATIQEREREKKLWLKTCFVITRLSGIFLIFFLFAKMKDFLMRHHRCNIKGCQRLIQESDLYMQSKLHAAKAEVQAAVNTSDSIIQKENRSTEWNI